MNLIPGYDNWLLAQADKHMSEVKPKCDCCGKPLSEDGICYACQEFDKEDD